MGRRLPLAFFIGELRRKLWDHRAENYEIQRRWDHFLPTGNFNRINDMGLLSGAPILTTHHRSIKTAIKTALEATVNDWALGKRMVEEMVLEHLLESLPILSGRRLTEDASGAIDEHDPPDFIIGLDGRALGIELTEIRDVSDAWDYYEEASRLAWQKHASYSRRGLFSPQMPMALILHSRELALYDIKAELDALDSGEEFEGTGFAEVWALDLNEAYYTPGHPLRRADMFCFKPLRQFGFHRVGWWDRKPFG